MTEPFSKPANAYRVLHTADWHLGRMLGEHSREEEQERFLAWLLGQLRELGVDALVVAGDVFDSANPPQSAVAHYYDFLSALFRQGGCWAVIVGGNHDSPAHLEAPRQVLKALRAHVVGSLPSAPEEVLFPLPQAQAPRLVVAAVPFLRDRDLRLGQPGQDAAEIQRALVEGIRRRYEEVAAAAGPWAGRRIPVLATGHLTVLGSHLSESEREVHVGGLGAVGADCFSNRFAYVALGHLHRQQAAGGCETVRYAGSPIPLSFSEAGDTKTVQVLDFVAGQLAGRLALPVPQARLLVRLSATRDTLASVLGQFEPPPAPLPAWVELEIEDPVAGEDLYGRTQDLARGKGFEVIRVIGKGLAVLSGMSAGDAPDADRIGNLLADPARVFDLRLDAEPGLTDAERESLRTAFRELLDLHAEQPAAARGSPGSGVPAPIEP